MAMWGAHGMVLGITVVKRAGPVGPEETVSRPSSPRADLFRLRSQELMVGWLRAFCRSPTFWPSSVVTLSTLRFCAGSEGAEGERQRVLQGPGFGAEGRPSKGSANPKSEHYGKTWQNQLGEVTWGPPVCTSDFGVPVDLWPRASPAWPACPTIPRGSPPAARVGSGW